MDVLPPRGSAGGNGDVAPHALCCCFTLHFCACSSSSYLYRCCGSRHHSSHHLGFAGSCALLISFLFASLFAYTPLLFYLCLHSSSFTLLPHFHSCTLFPSLTSPALNLPHHLHPLFLARLHLPGGALSARTSSLPGSPRERTGRRRRGEKNQAK